MMQRALVKSLDSKMYYGDVDPENIYNSYILVNNIAKIEHKPCGFAVDPLYIDMAFQYRKIWLNPQKRTDFARGFSELMFLYDAKNGIGNDKEVLDFLNVRDSVEIVTLSTSVLGQIESITSNGVITFKDAKGVQIADENGNGIYITLDRFRGFNEIFIKDESPLSSSIRQVEKKITFDFSRAAIRNKTLIKLFEDETK